MEEDITIDWETFVKSQLHWIRVVYKVEGRQEDLQEICNLYKEFADKKRPVMETDEEPGWEGNIILALGIDYGDCNLCGTFSIVTLKMEFSKWKLRKSHSSPISRFWLKITTKT